MNALADGHSTMLIAAAVAVFVFLAFAAFVLGKRAADRTAAYQPVQSVKPAGYRSLFETR